MGFIGVSVAWLSFILYHVLFNQVLTIAGMFVQLLGMSETFSLLLVLITLIVGGILRGLSALTGSLAYSLVFGELEKAEI